jgi:N6-adenosine-specific RNA methylase IME4
MRCEYQTTDLFGRSFEHRPKIVWVKDKVGTGHYVRGKHEELFICIKGKGLGLPAEKDRPESVIFAERTEHSNKPDIVYKIIERMFPHRKYIELFARGSHITKTGWFEVWMQQSSNNRVYSACLTSQIAQKQA